MRQIKKRNGKIQDFDIIKIAKAIYKARIDAGREKSLEYCVEEAKEVRSSLPNHGTIIDIEEIQNAIELYLIKKDEIEVFKLFTFYRARRKQERMNP